jgi:uncharacterized protein
MWTWAQQWLDLLFLHWRVSGSAVRRHLPVGLELDMWDGAAWISLVLFRMRLRPRGLPYLPGLSSLTEVNIRTYVRCGDKPGIHFLRLYGDNAWAVRLAQLLTPLPYRWMPFEYDSAGDQYSFAECAPGEASRLSLTFRPLGHETEADANSLDGWLLERYRAYTASPRHGVVVGEVAHPRWAVRPVEVSLRANRLGDEWHLHIGRPPDLTHFSNGLSARFDLFRRV